MTGTEALRDAVATLRAAGVDSPERDARRLLAYALDLPLERLTLTLWDPVPQAALATFRAAVARRASRQPVAQITGQRLFYDRMFRVTPDTLDPRPETEVLIAEALAQPFETVLDLGTGTGCILLTLLAERSGSTGLGVDLSEAALAVAEENAVALGLDDRASFRRSDWFATVTGRYDLIVANPPYIALSEMPALAPEVRDWEPATALTDGADGLTAYDRIAARAAEHLNPGGRLIVEIGPTQAAEVTRRFDAAGLDTAPPRPDLDGRPRVLVAALVRAPQCPA